MPKEHKIEQNSITESIERNAREVGSWPQWRRNLGGFRSNYPSELQPCKGELIDKEKTSITMKKQKMFFNRVYEKAAHDVNERLCFL